MHIFQAVLVGTEQSGGHLLEKEKRKNIKKSLTPSSLPDLFLFSFLHCNNELNISKYILRMKFYSSAWYQPLSCFQFPQFYVQRSGRRISTACDSTVSIIQMKAEFIGS